MLDANSVKKIQRALDAKEEDILLHQVKVRRLLRADHASSEAVEFQDYLRDSEEQIDAILESILTEKVRPEQYRQAAKDLCKRCLELHAQVRDMAATLAPDLADHRHVEVTDKKDVVRNVTFLVGIPAMLSTAAKNTGGAGHVSPVQAFVSGLGLSAAVLARARIAQSFRAAGRAFCELPDRIENSFALYYAKQEIMDAAKAIRRLVEPGCDGSISGLPKMASHAFGQTRKSSAPRAP
jgi:hypothetical protein